jgi:hypothetical protein
MGPREGSRNEQTRPPADVPCLRPVPAIRILEARKPQAWAEVSERAASNPNGGIDPCRHTRKPILGRTRPKRCAGCKSGTTSCEVLLLRYQRAREVLPQRRGNGVGAGGSGRSAGGPRRGLEDVESATFKWVWWLGHRRLLEPLEYIPRPSTRRFTTAARGSSPRGGTHVTSSPKLGAIQTDCLLVRFGPSRSLYA